MKIFWNLMKAELKSNFRNPIFLIFTVLLPTLLILLFGGLYGNDPMPLFNGYGAIDASTPAYLTLSLAIIALTGLPLQIVNYKEHKVLKRLKATPIKKGQIFLPFFLNYLILFLCGKVLLLLTGIIFFDLHFYGNIFEFLFALFISICATFSLGFLLSCLCNNVKQITMIGFALLIPMIFLSGATMPLGAFPDVMQNISKAIPMTYCVEFMQNTFLGKSFSENTKNIFVLIGIIVLSTGLSLKLFKWE